MSDAGDNRDEDDDGVITAAEYVLGVLPPEEARRFADAAMRDPALRRDIALWEERLAQLAEDVEAVAPPPHVWAAMRDALRREGARSSLWESVVFWRGMTFASLGTAAAVAMAAIIAVSPGMGPARMQGGLVAALASPEGGAAFVATYDPASRRIVIVPATVTQHPGKVPELWLVTHDKRVISLGVVHDQKARAVTIPPALLSQANAGAGLVITLEPPGGAPGGVATGPAVAKGELSPI